MGARAEAILNQRDTYFDVPHGRLKLRETEGMTAQLIAYERPNEATHRTSNYRIVEVDDAASMRLSLEATLGVSAVVAKTRRLYIWRGVRIHLDDVSELGSFIEFEAIAPPQSDLSDEETRVRTLRQAFGIVESDIVGGSYADLLVSLRQHG